ncbi:MAG: hypothetical protein KBI47_12210 [Armatimonadetes bacterium]|jgi:hypothetical protein|nr:hypothetical protein [Armatimonadota bacterium]MDI9583319.1 hypothetical protein [Acidobacteriota bacterium]
MSAALFALALLAALVVQATAKPELIVDIDFNDEVYIRPEPMTEEQVVTLVDQLHANGCETMLLRMGFLGLLPYRTQLSYPIRFDEEDFRAKPSNLKEDYIPTGKAWTEKYRKVIEAFNPPEVFIREGHKRGMKVVIWLDIFDDGVPGYRSKFLEEHPHCHWTARDGKTRFHGLMSYAWPEARAFRVAQANELLDLGADGIHCSTSAHSRHLPNAHEDDYYGFEQPIVDEYQRRFGVDIRTAEEFDKEAWHTIKGEAMNQLYRELAQACHGRGKELWVGLQLGEYTTLCADPHFGSHVVARYRNLWRELVDEGVADAFNLADYELPSSPGHGYWRSKADIKLAEGQDLFGWMAREYGDYCRGKTKLYLFVDWLQGDRAAMDAKLQEFAEHCLRYGFDGVDIHEAMNLEDKWDILQHCADRLKGPATN